MTRRLARANVENNPDILDEVSSLMSSVKNAWEQVPNEISELPDHSLAQKGSTRAQHSQHKSL